MYTIVVTNIPVWLGELHLKAHFSKFGKIKGIILYVNAKNLSTGKAEIEFYLESSVHKSLSLDGTMLDGARLKVESLLANESYQAAEELVLE
jgi:RNA recognition motif-containing protein